MPLNAGMRAILEAAAATCPKSSCDNMVDLRALLDTVDAKCVQVNSGMKAFVDEAVTSCSEAPAQCKHPQPRPLESNRYHTSSMVVLRRSGRQALCGVRRARPSGALPRVGLQLGRQSQDVHRRRALASSQSPRRPSTECVSCTIRKRKKAGSLASPALALSRSPACGFGSAWVTTVLGSNTDRQRPAGSYSVTSSTSISATLPLRLRLSTRSRVPGKSNASASCG